MFLKLSYVRIQELSFYIIYCLHQADGCFYQKLSNVTNTQDLSTIYCFCSCNVCMQIENHVRG